MFKSISKILVHSFLNRLIKLVDNTHFFERGKMLKKFNVYFSPLIISCLVAPISQAHKLEDPFLAKTYSPNSKSFQPRGQKSKPVFYADLTPFDMRIEMTPADAQAFQHIYVPRETDFDTDVYSDSDEIGLSNLSNISQLEDLLKKPSPKKAKQQAPLVKIFVEGASLNKRPKEWLLLAKGIEGNHFYPYFTAFGSGLYTGQLAKVKEKGKGGAPFQHEGAFDTLPVSFYTPSKYSNIKELNGNFHFEARMVRASPSIVLLYPINKVDTAGTIFTARNNIPIFFPQNYLSETIDTDTHRHYSRIIDNAQGTLNGFDALGFANRSVRAMNLSLSNGKNSVPLPSMVMQSYEDFEQSLTAGPLGLYTNKRQGVKGPDKHGFRPLYGYLKQALSFFYDPVKYSANPGVYEIPQHALIEADIMDMLSLRQVNPKSFPGNYLTVDEHDKAVKVEGFVFYYRQHTRTFQRGSFLVPTGSGFYTSNLISENKVALFESNILNNLKNLIESYLAKNGHQALKYVFRRLAYMSKWKMSPLLESPVFKGIYSEPGDALLRIRVFQAFHNALADLQIEYPNLFERDEEDTNLNDNEEEETDENQ